MSLDTEFKRSISGEEIFNSSLCNNYPIRDYFVNMFDPVDSETNRYQVSRKEMIRFIKEMSNYLLDQYGFYFFNNNLPEVFSEDKTLLDKDYQWKVLEAIECVAKVLKENDDEEFIFSANW